MSEEIDFKTIGIIGTGLIGGSFGKALLKRHEGLTILGFDKNEEELAAAIGSGCISEGTQTLEELAEKSDLIVLATPVRTYRTILKSIPQKTWQTTWLMDLGSVKTSVHQAVADLLPQNVRFVGGHPMAGSEKCGCLNGSADLFENKAFYLTVDNEAHLKPIRTLVKSVGANVKVIDPVNHDRIVSVTSHVPHITASMLVSILHDDISLSETGGGFQDSTRIAGSDPVMWTDILLTNKEAILKTMDQLHSEVHKLVSLIENEEEEEIFEYLEKNRDKRLNRGGIKNGNHNRRAAI